MTTDSGLEQRSPATAILACIHGNLEALEAVFVDIDQRGIERVICLGDVVGYGPNPLECLELVERRCDVVLRGNHDEAVVRGAHNFGLRARQVVEWTQRHLRPKLHSGADELRRWWFLESLPERHVDGPDLYVHGSPRDPCHEYILKQDLRNNDTQKFNELFSHFERLLFVGHSHIPGLITEDLVFRSPGEFDSTWDYPGGGKAIVNVGSVGQPRDQDARACYAILDGEQITWRRLSYDVEKAVGRIEANPNVHPSYAERLRRGI